MSSAHVLLLTLTVAVIASGWWARRHAAIPWLSLSGRARSVVLRAQRRTQTGDRRAGFVCVADVYRVEVPQQQYQANVAQIPWLQDHLASELAQGAHRLGAKVAADIEVLVVPSQDPLARRIRVIAHRSDTFGIRRVELQGVDGESTLRIPAPHALIGRHPRVANVLITDDTVSREHATVAIHEQQVTVVDHDTRNGTVHNGRQLPPHVPTQLEDGDAVAFGAVGFRVRIDRGIPGTAAVPLPPEAHATTSTQHHRPAAGADQQAPRDPVTPHGGGRTPRQRLPTQRLRFDEHPTQRIDDRT